MALQNVAKESVAEIMDFVKRGLGKTEVVAATQNNATSASSSNNALSIHLQPNGIYG